MRLCPYCGHEATGIGDGSDECLDYCKECLRLVEGETIDEAKFLREALEKIADWSHSGYEAAEFAKEVLAEIE